MHPLSNLIASDQIHVGDLLSVDFDTETAALTFTKEAEAMPGYEMAEMIDTASVMVAAAATAQGGTLSADTQSRAESKTIIAPSALV